MGEILSKPTLGDGDHGSWVTGDIWLNHKSEQSEILYESLRGERECGNRMTSSVQLDQRSEHWGRGGLGLV
jgi:hypothetical protein